MKSPERILIVRTDRIGDVIATLPMVTALKAHTSAEIVVMVRSYTAPLFEFATDADRTILYDPNFSMRMKVKVFTDAQADIVFFPNARPELLIAAAAAGIPRRVATAYRWYSPLANDKIYDHRKTAEHHESEYNVHMLSALGIDVPEAPLPKIALHYAQLTLRDQLLNELFGNCSAPFAVIHLGTGGSTQEWPIERFVEIACHVAQGLRLPIVWTGTEADRERIFSVDSAVKRVEPRAETFISIGRSLVDLGCLLSAAHIVIAGSTGPGHLAAALGAPTVGLFPLAQALSKERWGFRGKSVENIAPSELPTVSCPMCKECVCMQSVGVNDVIAAINRLMQ